MTASPTETAAHETVIAHDPVSGEPLGEVAATAPREVARIVGEVAQVQPLWALLRVQDRARYMRRVAQAIIDEFDELTELIGREQGRPRAEVATLELLPAIDALIWIAEEGGDILSAHRVGVHRSMFLAKRARVAYEPYGVVGVIGAGSAPFAQPLSQIAGALLAGNGVVFKPASRACLAGERIARVLARATLPEGLVRLVHGGAPLGVALAGAPLHKVLFTGSPTVGRAVARACVSQDREVTVELGGKDAMLVLADAHVPNAVAGALWAGCAGAGQARGSIERVYVAREVSERFLARLAAGAQALAVGDPRDPSIQVGPLASTRRLEHVSQLVADAVADGARLLCGGPPASRPSSRGVDDGDGNDARASSSAGGNSDARASSDAGGGNIGGAFYAPTVLSDVTHTMRIMREPVNGPVLAVMIVDSPEQAIQLANDGDYGLGASVWTADRYQGLRIARELDAGMVWLNDHLPGPAVSRGPWGASAGSGLGRTLGETGLRGCAQEKLITWDPPRVRGLWWSPYGETQRRAALAVAQLRSARDSDRERAWRHGTLAIGRVAMRALSRR